MERLQRIIDWLRDRGRRISTQAWAAARDPLRLLPIVAVGALLLIGIPYTATGLSRAGRAGMDWRTESRVRWHHANGTVTGVRDSDGLVARIQYRDDHHRAHVAGTRVRDTAAHWLTTTVRVKFDPKHLRRIEVLGFGNRSPVAGLLIACAPLGAGVSALIVSVGVWRRRRLVAVSAAPLAALRRPLNLGFAVVIAGVGAWAAGTVLDRGWSAIASSTSHLIGTVFGDLLGVLVPLVAFAFGALLTAWLARHRHHREHDGLLSRAHRLIDRAAGMVPSPEEMAPDESATERDPPSSPPNPEPNAPVRAG